MADRERDPHYEDMMARHRARRDVEWIPYQQRASDGACKFVDDGSVVTVTMEVAGLGTLVITANAKFSALLNQFKWDQTATLQARIE